MFLKIYKENARVQARDACNPSLVLTEGCMHATREQILTHH